MAVRCLMAVRGLTLAVSSDMFRAKGARDTAGDALRAALVAILSMFEVVWCCSDIRGVIFTR